MDGDLTRYGVFIKKQVKGILGQYPQVNGVLNRAHINELTHSVGENTIEVENDKELV